MALLPSTTYGCVVALLIVALALLQVLHMTLLNQLENKRSSHPQLNQNIANHHESNMLNSAIAQRLSSHRVLDSGGEYQIINDVFQASGETKTRILDVTLISHCSVHLIKHIPALVNAWHGPMSISIFLVSSELHTAVDMLSIIHQCVPLFQKFVAVHFVLPLSHQKLTISKSSLLPINCDEMNSDLQKRVLGSRNYALDGVLYPNNLLRNVALRNALTEYHLVIDVDMLPSPNLRQLFITFVKSQFAPNNRTAFVIPAFEMVTGGTFPQTKQHLLDLWDQGSIQPFYLKACWKCQRFTDYDSWRKLPDSDGLSPGYDVDWKDPWEPFFIASWQAPRYDERFKQYGFNRISQVCEMHVSGSHFTVLSQAYLVHQGFKSKIQFHSSKNDEQDKNRILFRRFKTELKEKYPDTDRRCY